MARAMPKEAVAAESLQSRLDRGERFDQATMAWLLAAVAEPLAEVHRSGRWHGSLTPADIHLDAVGEVELSGWGRDTTPDAMRASCYAPIECYAPVHPQGPWTDVYALGAIAWRAITGGPPAEVLHRKGDVTLARLAPPGFDPAFLRAVDAALEIAPQRRPKAVDQWLALFPSAGVPAAAAVVEIATPTAPPAAESAAVPPTATASRKAVWPLAGVAAVAAIIGALWRGPTPAPVPTQASLSPEEPAAAPVASELAAPPPSATIVAEPAPVATPSPPTQPAATPSLPVQSAPSPPPPQPKVEAVVPEPAPDPVPVVEVEPEVEPDTGEAPQALLVRADKRLRRLFSDYARLRAHVERSYDDPDIPFDVKQRAYREGLRIQEELVELRAVRNRIARTGDFQTANRRFDRLEAAAVQLSGRMEALRSSI